MGIMKVGCVYLFLFYLFIYTGSHVAQVDLKLAEENLEPLILLLLPPKVLGMQAHMQHPV